MARAGEPPSSEPSAPVVRYQQRVTVTESDSSNRSPQSDILYFLGFLYFWCSEERSMRKDGRRCRAAERL